MKKQFIPSNVILPEAIKADLNLRQRKKITEGVNKIIDALKIRALAVGTSPTYEKAQKIREARKSLKMHLAAIVKIEEEHGGFFENVIAPHAHRPEDRETALGFHCDAKRMLAMTEKAMADEERLFPTKGEMPGRVAYDIRRLMILNDLKPTVTKGKLWAQLIAFVLKESGCEATPHMVKNYMRDGVKIQKKIIKNTPK